MNEGASFRPSLVNDRDKRRLTLTSLSLNDTQKSVAVSLHNGFKHLLTLVHKIDFVMCDRGLGRPTADLNRATLASRISA